MTNIKKKNLQATFRHKSVTFFQNHHQISLRLNLDFVSGTVSERVLTGPVDGEVMEFPCINPKFVRKPYRYIYGIAKNVNHVDMARFNGSTEQLFEFATLARFDIDANETLPISLTQGGDINRMYFTEPQFVPRKGNFVGGELDGVIVATGNCTAGEQSFCFMFDATTMKEICRVEVPIIVNHGLHNLWVPDNDDYALKI